MKCKTPLRNKTSNVPADKTISEIERLLADFGASQIMKEYNSDSRVCSLAFRLGEAGYKLPVNMEGVYQVLYKDARPRKGRNVMEHREDQAYRTAWRIIKDWIHSQLSITMSGQATPQQVLLPYIFDGKRTLYEAYQAGALRLKAAGNNTGD
jgi:hypothetical protein